MMSPEDHRLLLRALDEELSPPEQARLDRLLATSDEARATWEAHRKVRRALGQARIPTFGPGFPDKVMKHLDPRLDPNARRRRKAVPRIPAGVRWAVAGVAIVLGVGLWLWYRPTHVTVPYSDIATFSLPDGSVVTLASGSRIRYRPFWGRASRTVHLYGEGFFSVQPAEKPFVVETFNARVVVRGTRFNVRAWPEERMRATVVALEEGAVEVEGRQGRAVRLSPGQATRVLEEGPPEPPRLPTQERPLAWLTGGFSFVNQPLADVLESLERRFAVTLKVDASVADRPVTYLNPRSASIEEVLGDICFSLDLRYRRVAGGYEVVPR